VASQLSAIGLADDAHGVDSAEAKALLLQYLGTESRSDEARKHHADALKQWVEAGLPVMSPAATSRVSAVIAQAMESAKDGVTRQARRPPASPEEAAF